VSLTNVKADPTPMSPQKRPMFFFVEIGGIEFGLNRDELEHLRCQISDALALPDKLPRFFGTCSG